jgi:hypothetical protein
MRDRFVIIGSLSAVLLVISVIIVINFSQLKGAALNLLVYDDTFQGCFTASGWSEPVEAHDFNNRENVYKGANIKSEFVGEWHGELYVACVNDGSPAKFNVREYSALVFHVYLTDDVPLRIELYQDEDDGTYEYPILGKHFFFKGLKIGQWQEVRVRLDDLNYKGQDVFAFTFTSGGTNTVYFDEISFK